MILPLPTILPFQGLRTETLTVKDLFPGQPWPTYNKILTSLWGLHLLQVRIDATLPRRDTDASPSVSPASGGDGQGSCMDRPPYYDLRSHFWLIFTFQWTVEARAVVHVAMGVDSNLLGDSMKLYKLAMFPESCIDRSPDPSQLNIQQIKKNLYHARQFYQCLALWSIHY